MKIIKTCLMLVLIIASGSFEILSAQGKTRPNIILILADDMGYSDIGSFGSEISTPNIDKLASSGVKLSQFYNSARCCPTRASLLTGVSPHMAGIGWMTSDRQQPGYRGELNNECVTIAQVLKTGGYATYASGKWHVTGETKYNGDKKNWPLQRGFDQYFGIIPGAANYFNPAGLTSGNNKITAGKDFYLTDAIADTAVKYINMHAKRKKSEPFFMYVAFNAPHWPLHAKPEDIKKYEDRYLAGWEEIRAQRYAKQLKLGLFDPSVKLSLKDNKIPDWNSLSAADKKLWAKRMAIYAAQIDCMDQGIGRILNELEKEKMTENTLIVFLSDNGGCAEDIERGEDKTLEGLGTAQSYQSYRINWANTSNTPFKLYKHYVHEGGISTPFIASWPNVIKPIQQVISTPASIIDIMPSFVEASGTTYPTRYKNTIIHPTAGKSLIALFSGKKLEERPLFWEHEANRAIRYQNWKLVSKAKKQPPFVGVWELYDITRDRSETIDLSKKYPEVVEDLASMWDSWAKNNRVYPLRPPKVEK
ncbi:arylsulfatase [Chitinophaga sp. XS-30]|nr:arylsulfatase [Chitinophaga sp. XS-30]